MKKKYFFITLLALSWLTYLTPLQTAASLSYTKKNDNLWTILRNHFQLSSTPRDEKKIQAHIQWYQQHPESLKKTLNNARYYLHYITLSLLAKQMPSEIALIPMIESHYDPFAHSQAGARGLWQIMPSLASGHQLRQNHWIDERRDIILSTDIALHHLNYLHKRFQGNWTDAINAYNAGEGRISNAIKHSKKTNQHYSQTLSRETQEYIPKLIALRRIISNPEAYQIQLPEIHNTPYFLPISLSRTHSFQQIESICDIPLHELRMLNPASRRYSLVNHSSEPIHWLLPSDKAIQCQVEIKNSYQDKKAHWQYIQPKQREPLTTLAKRYQTNEQQLAYLNWLLPGARVHPHQQLLVHKTSPSQSKLKPPSSTITADLQPGPIQINYLTKPGDTLSQLAERYRTTIEKITYWNRSAQLKPLKPNQNLTIWLKPKETIVSVKKNETLSHIATRHHISLESLIKHNKLSSLTIKENQIIKIPLIKPLGAQHATS